MTLQQLEYIVALDTYRHFGQAAESCHVTQPTLSMQIQKLEEELGLLLFDRSQQPVTPTAIGQALLEQAREVLHGTGRMLELAKDTRNEVSGTLTIGIIPTLAPYLLPLFIGQFTARYPAVLIQIRELLTEQIFEQLRKGQLDAGLLASPAPEQNLSSWPLFTEPFVVYAAPQHALLNKAVLQPDDLMLGGLWLMAEGHCFRSQVLNLCGTGARPFPQSMLLRYESGSLETLVRLVDRQGGYTLLPEMATLEFDEARQARIRPFVAPAPAREVCLMAHRSQPKGKLINALKREILAHLPKEIQ